MAWGGGGGRFTGKWCRADAVDDRNNKNSTKNVTSQHGDFASAWVNVTQGFIKKATSQRRTLEKKWSQNESEFKLRPLANGTMWFISDQRSRRRIPRVRRRKEDLISSVEPWSQSSSIEPGLNYDVSRQPELNRRCCQGLHECQWGDQYNQIQVNAWLFTSTNRARTGFRPMWSYGHTDGHFNWSHWLPCFVWLTACLKGYFQKLWKKYIVANHPYFLSWMDRQTVPRRCGHPCQV